MHRTPSYGSKGDRDALLHRPRGLPGAVRGTVGLVGRRGDPPCTPTLFFYSFRTRQEFEGLTGGTGGYAGGSGAGGPAPLIHALRA